MSARTAQASRAIRLAWIQEQELVREGKGTRDWTPEQQQNILERGRAYDETGRAFEGHHMKSVSAYPEYQGDPNNIQFLSREEHIKAHFDDVHNPTNGYYNPVTRETMDFGDNPPVPCERIKLSDSIILSTNDIKSSYEEQAETIKTEKVIKPQSPQKTIVKPKEQGSFLGRAVSTVISFYERNSHIIKPVVKVTGIALGSWVASKASGRGGSSSRSSSSVTESNSVHEESLSSVVSDAIQTVSDSYTPNDVPAGKQRYHYKDGSVKWKDKPAYHRGGNKEN